MRRATEIATSAVLLSLVGYAVWPLGDVPWKWVTHLPESMAGDLEIAAITLLVTAGIGFGMTAVGGLRTTNLAIGGVLAYTVWMAVLTVAISFHEPLLPFITYGLVLVGVLLGAVGGNVLGRDSNGVVHAQL